MKPSDGRVHDQSAGRRSRRDDRRPRRPRGSRYSAGRTRITAISPGSSIATASRSSSGSRRARRRPKRRPAVRRACRRKREEGAAGADLSTVVRNSRDEMRMISTIQRACQAKREQVRPKRSDCAAERDHRHRRAERQEIGGPGERAAVRADHGASRAGRRISLQHGDRHRDGLDLADVARLRRRCRGTARRAACNWRRNRAAPAATKTGQPTAGAGLRQGHPILDDLEEEM